MPQIYTTSSIIIVSGTRLDSCLKIISKDSLKQRNGDAIVTVKTSSLLFRWHVMQVQLSIEGAEHYFVIGGEIEHIFLKTCSKVSTIGKSPSDDFLAIVDLHHL